MGRKLSDDRRVVVTIGLEPPTWQDEDSPKRFDDTMEEGEIREYLERASLVVEKANAVRAQA